MPKSEHTELAADDPIVLQLQKAAVKRDEQCKKALIKQAVLNRSVSGTPINPPPIPDCDDEGEQDIMAKLENMKQKLVEDALKV